MLSRLQRALDNFDLRAYVEETFDDIIEAAEGSELRLNCFSPQGCARGDEKHKLYVNPDKKQWICFKCGYGTQDQPGTGSIVRFIADAEGIPPLLVRHRLMKASQPTPQEELEELIQGLFEPAPLVKPVARTVDLKAFHPLHGSKSKICSSFLKYLDSRGMTDNDVERYDIRYTINKDLGFQWVYRVIFPIFDKFGTTRSASGRLIHDKPNRPRWWHWPNTDIDQLLWPLTTVWGGTKKTCLVQAIDVILTEGIFDAFAVNKLLPHKHAFCTFGHKLSPGQIRILKDLDVENVTLAWDRDSKKHMITAARNLEAAGINARVIRFLKESYWQHHDLGDMVAEEHRKFQSVMARGLQQELDAALPVDDPEIISWTIS